MGAFAFVDLLEPGPAIRVSARIHFFSSENGGKSSPIAGVYRPNHNFGSPENHSFYIGQVDLPAGEFVSPGQTRELTVTFLNGPGLFQLLQIGRCWRIQEGRFHVANAELLAVLSES